MLRARVNGVELAYELRGAGSPLVMIHGAQGDQTMFSDLANRLADRFQVLTFDQRGSGLSEKPHAAYSIALLADDTAALMDHVRFRAAHIIGVSMGGTIGQELALRHPAKVRSLILGCTTPGGAKAIRIGGIRRSRCPQRNVAARSPKLRLLKVMSSSIRKSSQQWLRRAANVRWIRWRSSSEWPPGIVFGWSSRSNRAMQWSNSWNQYQLEIEA
jgi:pimeloyl-ACP methyl ester carboxylesterase